MVIWNNVCVCVYMLYKSLYLLFFGLADCSVLKVIHLMLRAMIFVS